MQNLTETLRREGEIHVESGDIDSALACYLQALGSCPGNTSILRDVGDVLQIAGDTEAASLCHRGVMPEHLDRRYFAAEQHESRLVSATDAPTTTHREAYEPERVDLAPPVRNAVSGSYGQFGWKRTDSKGAFVSVIDDGELWFDGFNTLVLDGQRRVIREHVKGNPWLADHAARLDPPVRLEGTVCFLDSRSSSIYYHWMVDVLPKLAVLDKAGLPPGEVDRFVVQASSGFQLETLAGCGIGKDRILTLGRNQHLKAERLLVPYLKHDIGERVYTGLGLGVARWAPEWLRKTFEGGDCDSVASGRVYISRSNRGTRGIENEQLLVAALRKRDFDIVHLENLSVAEQSTLMSRTAVVVGAHGAGMTNLCFCRPGAMIVEIFGDYLVPCYWSLSQLAGLRYRQYLAHDPLSRGTRPEPAERSVGALRDQSISLPLEDFLRHLDQWLDESGDAREVAS